MQHTLTRLDHGLEFIGAHLATDFLNTSSYRYDKTRAHEHIQTYADLVEFARQAGEIGAALARRLIAQAEAQPEKAAQIYRRAVATCACMFVDRNKSRSRRWCNEKTCGSRTTVRAFRQRQKRVARAR